MSETIYFRGIPYRRYPESKNRTHRLYFQRSAYKEFGGKTGFLHREVWEFYNGKIPKGLEIHHIDGDTTNNKISNLELLTHSQHAKKHNWGIWDGFNEHQKMLVQKAKQWRKDNPQQTKVVHSKLAKKGWQNRRGKEIVKICSVCGKRYKTYFPKRSKYCHPNCRATALRRKRGIQPRY